MEGEEKYTIGYLIKNIGTKKSHQIIKKGVIEMTHNAKQAHNGKLPNYDAIVIGAGFSGLYMLHRLREAGCSVQVYEAGSDVGGTWYWNRYPGARCDIESMYYNYTFSEELLGEWNWSSRYAAQPEILNYIHFVADKFDLRRNIQFNTRVTTASYDEKSNHWSIHTNNGLNVTAKYLITALGCLSAANKPNFDGIVRFKGEIYHTGDWPHEKVNFKGKRVGVIGTGSSGVQAIPVIAKEADQLTVFQRTPQYSTPAHNHSIDEKVIKETWTNYHELRKFMQASIHGIPDIPRDKSALEDEIGERQLNYEKAWNNGGLFTLMYCYNDIVANEAANETASEFIRSKIKEIVDNPDIAEKLMPSYHYATKRPIIDTDYFETYNRNNVSLVDLKTTPIKEVTPIGVRTTEAEHELDVIVFATGFDAITGPLFNMDIRGKDGVTLKDKWAGGADIKTYLGIAASGFPNLFMITGPESPSVLSNMIVSIEQHVEWIADCIDYLGKNKIEKIEAKVEAEASWKKHCMEVAQYTLLPKADSWYMGANIEGKPRGSLVYMGGVGQYRQICEDVAIKGYEGFSMEHIPEVSN
ncbi:NAD(P)/FAD-dependent oxidoreductase [Oceanobacillus sp. J11TS1]|uniref:flavin-containing monooxygenase n=1 Tax=Oceanobacillus sp. J11TS1 TaxID=2807191 RepID=UPI001B24DE1B|nr:NAD(P)/FAD-dependent oxidoreductase [Oceanobacillus sp. J11TS1]GIO24066.1 cyclohexanone monooxygenase [Oceanobacillus sp. J11TS1]